MCRQLLFTVVFCLYLASALSLICYSGTDRQCILAPNMKDCGSDETCQCTKYRFQCTENDQACTEQEKANKVKKWIYTILPASTCRSIRSMSSIYEDVSCCSTNKCNRPASGRCSWSQARRRSTRRLTDLLDF